jgi:hypothetical protein
MSEMSVEVQMTLDDSVAEVLGMLTGLDLTYEPGYDRYRAVTRQLNRALRGNALEQDWSYYSTVVNLGSVTEGDTEYTLAQPYRARILDDDAVRLVDPDGKPLIWAYILPRDSLHKYANRRGLWCAIVRKTVMLSRPITLAEQDAGLTIHVPVMREPTMFRLPPATEEVDDDIRNQLIDFDYPDVVIARAAWLYAQADPVMQPRAQTLEANYKNMMYSLIERDTDHTDSAYLNEFIVPIQNSVRDGITGRHTHPHAGGY